MPENTFFLLLNSIIVLWLGKLYYISEDFSHMDHIPSILVRDSRTLFRNTVGDNGNRYNGLSLLLLIITIVFILLIYFILCPYRRYFQESFKRMQIQMQIL